METEIDERIRRGFSKQGLMSTLGAAITEVKLGYCSIAVPYSQGITQQHGFFHGGVTAAIADNAAGFASYTLMEKGEQPLSLEFKINLIAPARGDSIEARATVLKAGRRIKHVTVNVYCIEDDSETLVAAALATVVSTRAV